MTSTPHTITVLLIDDHRRVHEMVSIIIESAHDIKLVDHGSNGLEAVELCKEHQPDIVLMDVVMPKMDGIQATQIIRQQFPKIKILVLSSFEDHHSVHEMLSSGASGYITKSNLSQDLLSIIRTTYIGQTVISPNIAKRLLESADPLPVQHLNLTDRELEVLGLMAEGLNNAQIGKELVISSSTVKFHIINILEKLGTGTRAEALVVAVRNNLV